MGTGDVHVAAFMDGSVPIDDVVVADVAPTPLTVPSAYVIDGVVAALGGGRAMDDDFTDGAARLLPPDGNEFGERGGAYNAVGLQSVRCLNFLTASSVLMPKMPSS